MPASGEPAPRDLVQSALDLMNGGAGRAMPVYLEAEGETYKNLLEQSERPDGPWIKNHGRFTAEVDLAGMRVRIRTRSVVPAMSPEPYGPPADILSTPQATGVRLGGSDAVRPAPAYYRQMATGFLRSEPISVLTRALTAADLDAAGQETLQDRAHHVLTFIGDDGRYRLYINPLTGLPTAVDRISDFAGSTMLNPWGAVTVRTLYSFWWTTREGRHYPKQWDISLNGRPWISRAISKLQLAEAVPDPARFDWPAGMGDRLADAPAGGPGQMTLPPEGVEIRPGIVLYKGRWNVIVVAQEDGLIILDAPISSAYSARVIDRMATRFPDKTIKAVITTSDAWPHMGGVREYAGRGVPVYHLAVNGDILAELLAAPRINRPDSLSASKAAPDRRPVDRPIVLGQGDNRLRLIPIAGEGTDHMMMAFFPEHRLLYTSDAVILDRDGTVFPHVRQYVFDVAQAICRHSLAVDQVAGFHIPITDWPAVREQIPRRDIGSCQSGD